jgi:hypothetical protein
MKEIDEEIEELKSEILKEKEKKRTYVTQSNCVT